MNISFSPLTKNEAMERLTNLDKRKSVIDAEMEKCRAIIKRIYEEEAAEELKRRM